MYGNDDIIRNIDEDEVQTGRGEKRKNQSDDEEPVSSESEDEQGQYYYHLESRKKIPFQKIRYDSHRSQGTIQ